MHKLSHNLPPHHLPAGKAIALPCANANHFDSVSFSPLSNLLATRELLRQCITKHRDSTIPLHPPTTTVVFARHARIQDQLRNWRKAHRTWKPNHSPSCTCQQHFLQYSGRSTFFPPEKQLRQSLVQAIHRWRKQHHLPIPQQDDAAIQQFVSQQMTLHQQHQQQTLNLHIVKNATRHIPTGIVHCEDHVPNRLMWCCPTIYSDAISATFLDESVFHQLHIRPLTHHLNTYNNIAKLLPQYKWALKEWGRVPTANIDPPQGQKAVSQGQAHRLLYGSHDASSHP